MLEPSERISATRNFSLLKGAFVVLFFSPLFFFFINADHKL